MADTILVAFSGTNLHAEQAIALLHGAEAQHNARVLAEALLHLVHDLVEPPPLHAHVVDGDQSIAHLSKTHRRYKGESNIRNEGK